MVDLGLARQAAWLGPQSASATPRSFVGIGSGLRMWGHCRKLVAVVRIYTPALPVGARTSQRFSERHFPHLRNELGRQPMSINQGVPGCLCSVGGRAGVGTLTRSGTAPGSGQHPGLGTVSPPRTQEGAWLHDQPTALQTPPCPHRPICPCSDPGRGPTWPGVLSALGVFCASAMGIRPSKSQEFANSVPGCYGECQVDRRSCLSPALCPAETPRQTPGA